MVAAGTDSPSAGQADVVLGKRGLGRLGAREICALGALDMLVETAVFREAVEEPRHLPGESFGLPDTGERAVGTAIERDLRPRVMKFGKRRPQVIHVAGRAVEALGPVQADGFRLVDRRNAGGAAPLHQVMGN